MARGQHRPEPTRGRGGPQPNGAEQRGNTVQNRLRGRGPDPNGGRTDGAGPSRIVKRESPTPHKGRPRTPKGQDRPKADATNPKEEEVGWGEGRRRRTQNRQVWGDHNILHVAGTFAGQLLRLCLLGYGAPKQQHTQKTKPKTQTKTKTKTHKQTHTNTTPQKSNTTQNKTKTKTHKNKTQPHKHKTNTKQQQ